MFTPRSADDDAVLNLAQRHGLAPAALFKSGERSGNGQHSVLLDGPLGSFAVSTGTDVEPSEASSWAWSSNLPHHVLIKDQDVQITRWDKPREALTIARKTFDAEPDRFFDGLRRDRVEDGRNMVAHAMELFRRVRSAIHQAGLPDASSMTAYLGILAATCEGHHPTDIARARDTYVLPDDFVPIIERLPGASVDVMMQQFTSLQVAAGATLRAYPSLALRHASGAIFQEAHHKLLEGGRPDFFEGFRPAKSKRISRGVVHFTPPSLARGLAEQALDRLPRLHERPRIAIADIACGSGAFLIECLRALERRSYSGQVHIYGRDISPPAVDMARFILSLAAAEWPGPSRTRIDIGVQDTLSEMPDIQADIMVLNPPFLAWTNQSELAREQLRSVLGDAFAYRPDISMGFVVRALAALRADGVLAALVPASTLETAAGAKWRSRLTERHRASLVARFDNLSIFPDAMVRIGALVLGGAVEDPVEVRSGTAPEAVSDVLRALRRGERGDDASPERPATWTIRQLSDGLRISPGLPARTSAWWATPGTTHLQDLFDITQGIRTGANKVFLLRERDLERLPDAERRAFRSVISSDDIVNGHIATKQFVFYPYYAPFAEMSDEAQLRDLLPTYTALYLGPARARLMTRTRVGARWWLLAEPRRKAALTPPLFIVKYFAGVGGVAMNFSRGDMVVQGFGWSPTERFLQDAASRPQDGPSPLLFAYLAFLNSPAFFEVVAACSSVTNGGQFDMSHRYTAKLPIVDLRRVGPSAPAAMRVLADVGRAMYAGEVLDSRSLAADVDAAVRELYAASGDVGHVQDRAADDVSTVARPEPVRPAWLQTYLDAEQRPEGRKHRVAVLCALMDRAKAGAFEEIDAGLRGVDVTELNDQGLITLLRGTFAIRPRLQAWAEFRDRVAETFEARGRDVGVMLIGLDP